jgi:hypothetical protein
MELLQQQMISEGRTKERMKKERERSRLVLRIDVGRREYSRNKNQGLIG